LLTRERIVEGMEAGLVAKEGLIAHGRGEAFDYLLGETTIPPAAAAARAAAAHLLLARNPVLSVNGNTAVLVPGELAALQKALACKVEVNLFHRTEERVKKLKAHLEAHGCERVLGVGAQPTIPGLDHERAKSTIEGIYGADVVLVPLEDGDRCQALRNMGKTIIVVDLNPLSRTARTGSVTLVDNVARAVPNVTREVEALKEKGRGEWEKVAAGFSNAESLAETLRFIARRLETIRA
jgi:4-phosphopantoate--beta-alanine ligase